MWNKRESVKVILPGEIGIVEKGSIGTFAVGARGGCKGYLVYDDRLPIAGLAHVDFDQDLVAVSALVVQLYSSGARDLVIGATDNADLESVSSQIRVKHALTRLPSPEFVFDSNTNRMSRKMDMADKESNLPARKKILAARLNGDDHTLLWV